MIVIMFASIKYQLIMSLAILLLVNVTLAILPRMKGEHAKKLL